MYFWTHANQFAGKPPEQKATSNDSAGQLAHQLNRLDKTGDAKKRRSLTGAKLYSIEI